MGKFTEFNVPLKSFGEGLHEMNFHLGKVFFENMENSDVKDSDLNVKLTITNKAGRYDLRFDIGGEVLLLCDRCLDDLHFPIEAEYRIMVEYGADYNSDSDDLLIIPESDNTLNVAYMIYDTVVLAIPMKHVHPMGKCNRQMSALLRKHRARPTGEDAEMEEELIEEMDSMESEPATDPRWDGLKGFNSESEE